MHIYIVQLLSLVLLSTTFCHSAPFNFTDIETLFSFGDSYSTQGLNLTTLTYPCRDCTSAGGPNWIEYLVQMHPMRYWNLAYNSAPIANYLVGQNNSKVIDVTTQVTSLFPQHFVNSTSVQWTPATSLFTIWVGINDIDLTSDWNNTVPSLNEKLMLQLSTLMSTLRCYGAENYMLVNVPPIDRSPLWIQQGPEAAENTRQRVIEYNRGLDSLHKELVDAVGPGHVYLFDAWSAFTDILDNPGGYELSITYDYCPDWSHPTLYNCSTIDQYFWYNDLHPTFKIHYYLAQAIYKLLNDESN